jgi:response regulator of citrate/malate metabolism
VRDPAFLLPAAFQSGIEAESDIRRLKPNFILVDLHLPDSDGLTFAGAIKLLQPGGCVVLPVDAAKHTKQALDCGAVETIVKRKLDSKLIPSLRRVRVRRKV